MKYFIAASLLTATVSAVGLADLPPCSITCATGNLEKFKDDFAKCGGVDIGKLAAGDDAALECLCKTTGFQEAFSTCAKGKDASCDAAAQCKLWTVSQETCKKYQIDLPKSLDPGTCDAPAGGAPGGGETSPVEPTPEEPSAPAAARPPPADETTTAAAEETSASAPAETSAPAEPTDGAGAPPSYGSPTTVATAASTDAGAAASGQPTYTPSSASTVVLSGFAALFAGFVAVLAL